MIPGAKRNQLSQPLVKTKRLAAGAAPEIEVTSFRRMRARANAQPLSPTRRTLATCEKRQRKKASIFRGGDRATPDIQIAPATTRAQPRAGAAARGERRNRTALHLAGGTPDAVLQRPPRASFGLDGPGAPVARPVPPAARGTKEIPILSALRRIVGAGHVERPAAAAMWPGEREILPGKLPISPQPGKPAADAPRKLEQF